MKKLLLADIRDMQQTVPYLIGQWVLANHAAKASALALRANTLRKNAYDRLVMIGDDLTQAIANCEGIEQLVNKHRDHGYRPTLRGKHGSAEQMLAAIYDLVAEANGREARAYYCER